MDVKGNRLNEMFYIPTLEAKSVYSNSSYIVPGKDTLNMTSTCINPNNTPITVEAIFNRIQNTDQTPDTVAMFDDGINDNGIPEDNIYGVSWPVPDVEDHFYAHLLIKSDSRDDLLYRQCEFTTIGPLVLKSYRNSKEIEHPQSGVELRYYITLENTGHEETAPDISTRLVSLGSFGDVDVDRPEGYAVIFKDIPVGGVVEPRQHHRIRFADSLPDCTLTSFQLNIFSNNYLCWIDTLEILINVPASSVGPDQGGPKEFALCQNYPNPYNPNTQIEFSLPKSAQVKLEIFNAQGRLVTTLANQRFEQGNHELIFDGHDYPSGLYVYRLTTPDFVQQRKMILMK